MPPRLVTLDEIAARTERALSTVRFWRLYADSFPEPYSGKSHGGRNPENKLRFKVTDVERWMKANRPDLWEVWQRTRELTLIP